MMALARVFFVGGCLFNLGDVTGADSSVIAAAYLVGVLHVTISRIQRRESA